MKLTTDQISILQEGRIEDNRFYLQWQLDRKQYININEVLNTIGLIWNKWKKAHIAEWLTNEDLINAISDIVEIWEVETLKETIKKFQFYPTPKEVAEYLVELADIKENDNILEPSAWLWNIAEYLPNENKIILIELDEGKYWILKEKFKTKWFMIVCSDFLTENLWWNKIDKIIANPPFSKSQDVKHILHMYELLNKWWRLVSIASSSIQTREGKLYDELRALNPEFIELPKWSFKESWTMVNTIIVLINK